ncbi:unnamed protein product [Sphacelaria rigidula]
MRQETTIRHRAKHRGSVITPCPLAETKPSRHQLRSPLPSKRRKTVRPNKVADPRPPGAELEAKPPLTMSTLGT